MIVVHCKGGKGRTGTMICVWLVESGVFSSATESLDYFGNRRTDTNVSTKFQGVSVVCNSVSIHSFGTKSRDCFVQIIFRVGVAFKKKCRLHSLGNFLVNSADRAQ